MNEDDNQRRREELWLQDEERRIAAATRNAAVTRIVQLVQFLTGALGVLLLLRVFLRLFAANPNNQFAQVIYGISNPFVAPFANLFRNPVLGSSIVFDINALVTVLAYALLGWLVGQTSSRSMSCCQNKTKIWNLCSLTYTILLLLNTGKINNSWAIANLH